MKKKLIIFIFLSIFLTGCQNKEISPVSFIDASAIFSQQLLDLNQKIKNFGNHDKKNTHIASKIKGENKDFKINSNIILSGNINYDIWDFDLSYDVFLYFWDKKEQKETNISGKLNHKKTGDSSYIKFKEPIIDIGLANYQGNLLSLIANHLENKRILVEQNKKQSLMKTMEDIKNIFEIVSNINVFTKTEQRTYESRLAYKIEFKQDSLDYINSKINGEITKFNGLLIVNSDNNIDLKIDELLIKGYQDLLISGFLGKDKIHLKIKKNDKKEYVYEIGFDFTKKTTNIYLSQKMYLQELFNLNININNKQYADKIKNQITSNLKISPLIVYGSDLEKDIKININIEQILYPQELFLIEKPGSYIIGQQILGDEFSLKTVMSEANVILETKD